MVRVAASLLVTLFLAACTAQSSPVPGVLIFGVNVVCDPGPSWPLAPTCASAVIAALPRSGYDAPAIDFAEYHFGAHCAPGAPCPSAPPNYGYLVVHPRGGGPAVLVQLAADGSGNVTVEYAQPFPSTGP